MFNVTVIRLKDLIRYLIILIVIAIVILGIKRYLFNIKLFELDHINLGEKIKETFSDNILYTIKKELPILEKVNSKNESKNEIIDENKDSSNDEFMSQVYLGMIKTEIKIMNTKLKNEEENLQLAASGEEFEEEKKENSNKKEENKKETKEEKIKTEVVTKNPLKENYTDKYKNIKIKNETKYELTEDILNYESLNIDKSNIIIFHTHTCESYTPSEKYTYTQTGNFRTTDTKYSVVRVGDELTNYLTNNGIKVIHDKTFHDYPAYNGSYNRSLSTVSKILANKKADIIIDLHRDAIGSYSSYAPTVKIGDDFCAQLMFVMGTNGGGLYHPNWQTNLKWAVSIQKKANEIYPGLFKPIIVRNSRYNQHLGKAACIIEVGSTGNTLEQCLNSMKYLSNILRQ